VAEFAANVYSSPIPNEDNVMQITTGGQQLQQRAIELEAARGRTFKVFYCGQYVANATGANAAAAIDAAIETNSWYSSRRSLFSAVSWAEAGL
jgi:hypothetical protein